MTVFWSVILIIMLSITIGLLHFSEIAVETILDEQAALYTSILLCIVSLIYSYNVINNKSWIMNTFSIVYSIITTIISIIAAIFAIRTISKTRNDSIEDFNEYKEKLRKEFESWRV